MTDWQNEDKVTTTYGALQRSMAEAAKAERDRIIELLKLVDYAVLVDPHWNNDVATIEQKDLLALICSGMNEMEQK
jgi:hypothetical protein